MIKRGTTPTMTREELRDAARRMVLYFEPTVLASYRDEAHRYDVKTDNFEGSVGVRSDFYEGLPEPAREEHYITVDFGFRARPDGSLAVAAWAPDIAEKTSEAQRKKWAGFLIAADSFPDEFDARFELWMQRHLAVNWDVEDGPLSRLLRVIAEINAVTSDALGMPLLKAEETSDLLFPAAENDAAYAQAHSAVYGLIIDGFDKRAIAPLAEKLGASIKIASDKTLEAMKKVLRDESLDQSLFSPLEVVSRHRRLSDHNARPKAMPFAAFDQFSRDVEAVVSGLTLLRDELARRLDVDVGRCVDRQAKMKYLPRIDPSRHPRATYSIVKATKIIGKTVARVEYGFRVPVRGVHESEVLILHFTDGSILGVDVGSNASHFTRKAPPFRPEDFHCDLALSFVPPRQRSTGTEDDDSGDVLDVVEPA